MHRRSLVAGFVLSLFLAAGPATAESLRFVPLDDPVYDFLEYARTASRLEFLPRVRPYAQRDVTRLLNEVLGSADNAAEGRAWISTTARLHLERLSSPRRRLAESSFSEDGSITVDGSVVLRTDAALNRLRDTIPTLITPFGLGIDLADDIHVSLDVVPRFAYWAWYEEPYPLYEEPLLRDYYTYTYWFDTGDGSFNHGATHEPGRDSFRIAFDTTNQFSVNMEHLTLTTGRHALDWGPASEANLILSGTAKPYDYIGFTLPLGGSGTFAWTTAILQDFAFQPGPMEERLLSAHRIGYQITDWLYLALYESVVYDFTFELAYLNPLSFYYITEVTQGSDDNKLGGVDLVVNLPNVELYGSFFGDDWDAGRMFSLNSSHNIWAGILGARTAGLFAPGLSLNLELAYLSHWMYTHFTWESLSDVGRSYQHYGAHLGHYLDPNSWMAYLGGRYDFAPQTTAGAAFRIIQNGRGDINDPANWQEESELHGVDDYRDIYYTFLDRGKEGFTIDTTLDWSVSGRHLFPDTGLAVEGEYTVQYSFAQATEDLSIVPDSPLWEHFLSVQVSWTPGVLWRGAR